MHADPKEPTPSNTRKWLVIGLLVVIAWGIFTTAARHFLEVDELTPPSLARFTAPRPVDYGWTLLDLDDKPVEFAQFQGRPILLNLWATWCGPCLEEMPSIASLAAREDLKGRDIVFLCVSTDKSAEDLRSFMKNKDWKFTVLRATSLPACFQTEGIPATFLIDPEGRIAASEMGAARWDDPSVIAFLQKLAGK
jgi:thiol-disulfide isomerase/thioredoxin